jgi:hypothetical protein
MCEFRNVSPLEYARQFAESIFVNHAAVNTLNSRTP